jgi:hypothetical protein
MKEWGIKIIKIGDHRSRCQARTNFIIWGSRWWWSRGTSRAMLILYCGIIERETHLWCERILYEVYSLRRSIVEVTELRAGCDVRGSPLTVIMGLLDSRTAHTTPRLASILPSDMPFSGGSYQSREKPGVVSRKWTVNTEGLLSLWRNYAGYACEQARQLLVNCE